MSPFRLEFILMGIAAGIRIRTADPVRFSGKRGEEKRGVGLGGGQERKGGRRRREEEI